MDWIWCHYDAITLWNYCFSSDVLTFEGTQAANNPDLKFFNQNDTLANYIGDELTGGTTGITAKIHSVLSGVETETTAKKVEEWLDIVGLKGFGNTPTYQLSGGMQQRVALARCLINDPDLILMDEPLGALDALTREKMQSLVLKIWKETGKTIILITHSVEEALLLGERLYVMAPRPGRIHKEYNLPFASMGLKEDLRDIKNLKDFTSKREEILTMIWNMEEEIMGKDI